MKKFAKRAAVLAVSAVMVAGGVVGLTACGGSSKTKIGVLVADVSGAEALSFKAYYQEYVAKQYTDVEFVYSPAMESAADEKSQIEKWAGQGYKAVISLSDQDRAQQVQTCISNKLYYAVATGVMDDATFDTYKANEYFVGQIGPNMQTEYEAGLEMGQYYATKELSHIGLYGAFIPNPMHTYRFAGVITGLGLTYDGATGMDIAGKIGYGNVDPSMIAGDIQVSYMGGYDPATIYTTLGETIESGIQAFVSIGMTTTFFAEGLNNAHVPYSDIDAFTSANGELMKSGSLEYLAGKKASDVGPVFAAVMSAVNGHAIRDNGNAISINQGYTVVKSYAEFGGDSLANPVYNKTVLDSMISTAEHSVSYDTFKNIVLAH